MNRIDHWIPDTAGHIRGDVKENGKGIRTSRIVSRVGNIITTKSGSQYELGTPHPYIDCAESIRFTFPKLKAQDCWELLDLILEQQK